jgi:hypothetical protein
LDQFTESIANWAAAGCHASSSLTTTRLTAARLAVLAAWLEAIDPSVADTLVTAALSWNHAGATIADRAELYWLDGMVGVLQGNASRYQAAKRRLSDTSLTARHTAASLAAFWLNRDDPGRAADSLQIVADDVMRTGSYVMPAEALGRLLIARKLRKQNEPHQVERYLMWGDGGLNTPSSVGTRAALGSITTFERASALDAAGNREAAIKRYRQFHNSYDRAPSAHREMVAEAKARLAILDPVDSRQTKSVPPNVRK